MQNKFKDLIFKLFSSIALRIQELSSQIPLPRFIKKLLRNTLTTCIRKVLINENVVENWSRPLINRHDVSKHRFPEISHHNSLGFDKKYENLNSLRPLSNVSVTKNKSSVTIRCLLVSSSLDVGGMDEVVVFLALGLPRFNVEVKVLHASNKNITDGYPTGRLGRLLLEQGVETVEYEPSSGFNWIRAWQPDVISAHDAPEWVLKCANILGIPYVDTLHGMHSLFSADWMVEKERGKLLSGIVSVSDLVRSQYLHNNPKFPSDKIVTIPNGVDESRRKVFDRDSTRLQLGIDKEYVFLTLGRLCLQKNTYGLIAGFADVAEIYPEAHLVLAGRVDDPVYLAQVQKLCGNLPCKNRIHLRDHNPEPSKLLAAADSFVLDSFFEGWSLASMEALYAGVPVVLSEVGGAREQIGTGNARGYLIPNPVGDPLIVNWETIRESRFKRQVNRNALVESMCSLVKDRNLWLSRREQLISESAVRFHPDICLDRHAKILSAVARGETNLQSVLQAENIDL